MECPSKETLKELTAPELTRLRASQPFDWSAGMSNNGELVLVQVSGGNDDMLKPGLNSIGGKQPRGLRTFMGASGDPEDVGAADWSVDMGGDEPDATVAMVVGAPPMLWCIPLAFIPGAEDWLSGVMPSPGPAWRMLSGRHWTLPRPLASTLSTHDGKAPVSK